MTAAIPPRPRPAPALPAALAEHRWPPHPAHATTAAALAALSSRRWTGGHFTQQTEDLLADATGAAHAIAFNSCTSALHAVLLAHGADRGTSLHTPAFGFTGTLTGASHIGMTLRYHDIDPATGNTPALPASGLVLTPDLHGVPHTLDRTRVITDACQSLGTRTGGRHIGHTGTHCWSFSASKLVSAPDGGAVTTNDDALAAELRQLRDYGTHPGPARANALVTARGHNWRPSELTMALTASQLPALPETAARAHHVGSVLTAALASSGLWHQTHPPDHEPAWHKIRTGPGRLTPRRARRLQHAFHDAGLPTHRWGVHPLPVHPFHKPGTPVPTPTADTLAAATFCLGTEHCPPWTWTDAEVNQAAHIIETLKEQP